MKEPKVIGTMKIKDIPPAETGRDGKRVSARPWKKIVQQVFDLPYGTSLIVEAKNEKAWLAGRFYTCAQRMQGKVKIAFRRDKMYIWRIA